MRDACYSSMIFNIPQEQNHNLLTELESFNLNVGKPRQYIEENQIEIEFENILQYWIFIKEFQKSPYYVYWDGYSKQKEITDFADSINSGNIEWDMRKVKKILHNEQNWWAPRGDFESWYHLAALLRKGYIQVEVLPSPLVNRPSEGSEEFKLYFYAMTSRRGNLRIGGATWVAWNWLKEQGDPLPGLPSSLSNVCSEELAISVKVGEGDPFQILSYLLGKDKKYVHIPLGDVLYLYIFTAGSSFMKWRTYSRPEREEIIEEANRLLHKENEMIQVEER